MSGPIEQTYVTDFKASLEMALQQKRSLLRQSIEEPAERPTGQKKRLVERVEPIEIEEVTGKHQASNPREMEWEQRWVSGKRYRAQTLVDKIDKLHRISDPTNAYVQAVVTAFKRGYDRKQILPAFFAPAYTGEEGNTVVAFPTGGDHNVTAAGNTSANYLAAFRKALALLENKEVDLTEEPVFAVINPDVKEVLFDDVKVLSSDYQSQSGVIQSYSLPKMYGINWIVHTGVPTPGSGNIEVPLYTKKAMNFTEWDELETFIDRRHTHNHDWQISAYQYFGATRQDEKRIVRIRLPIPS